MKTLLITLLALLLSLGIWSCSDKSTAEQTTGDSKATPVKTSLLQPREFSEYLRITGTVQAKNRVNIVVEESGTLKNIYRDKGNYVRKNDTLAVLENETLVAAYADASAALKQAEVNFKSSQILFDKKATSENDYLNAKYALERARAQYDLAKARYSKLFVTAPLSGFINNRYHDLGAYLMATTPLFDLIDNSRVKILAGVAERFRSYISKNTPVEITFDAFQDLKIDGKITFVHQSIDPINRTFRVEMEIQNPNRKLAPNMIANLKILRQKYEDKIVIPVDALIESEKGRFVFIVNDLKAKKVQVDILVVYKDSVLVNGLYEGQKLVVVGHQELTEGDSLQILTN